MYVCVYVYVCIMYVHMYVCMYVLCVYVCMYACIYVCMYVCIMYVCMCVYVYNVRKHGRTCPVTGVPTSTLVDSWFACNTGRWINDELL